MLSYTTLLMSYKAYWWCNLWSVLFSFPSHEKVLGCCWECKEDLVKDQRKGRAWTGVMLDTRAGWERLRKGYLCSSLAFSSDNMWIAVQVIDVKMEQPSLIGEEGDCDAVPQPSIHFTLHVSQEVIFPSKQQPVLAWPLHPAATKAETPEQRQTYWCQYELFSCPVNATL